MHFSLLLYLVFELLLRLLIAECAFIFALRRCRVLCSFHLHNNSWVLRLHRPPPHPPSSSSSWLFPSAVLLLPPLILLFLFTPSVLRYVLHYLRGLIRLNFMSKQLTICMQAVMIRCKALSMRHLPEFIHTHMEKALATAEEGQMEGGTEGRIERGGAERQPGKSMTRG